jgi:hypothetical protein
MRFMNARSAKVSLTLALVASALLACTARKRYPDPAPGWHSPDYSVVFGRLMRVPLPAPDPASPAPPPAWVIRFGDSTEQYGGEFALTPPERMVGYAGGEPVEIRGHLMEGATNDPYSGRWYVVDAIRMWHPHR